MAVLTQARLQSKIVPRYSLKISVKERSLSDLEEKLGEYHRGCGSSRNELFLSLPHVQAYKKEDWRTFLEKEGKNPQEHEECNINI